MEPKKKKTRQERFNDEITYVDMLFIENDIPLEFVYFISSDETMKFLMKGVMEDAKDICNN